MLACVGGHIVRYAHSGSESGKAYTSTEEEALSMTELLLRKVQLKSQSGCASDCHRQRLSRKPLLALLLHRTSAVGSPLRSIRV